jgi:ribosomal protein S18 acetylase RimI-like enzyme
MILTGHRSPYFATLPVWGWVAPYAIQSAFVLRGAWPATATDFPSQETGAIPLAVRYNIRIIANYIPRHKPTVKTALIPMEQHPIYLRPANPTHEEGLLFARYLDQAAEGFFRFMLGRRVAEIVAEAYLQPCHDLSYQNAIFAERDGVIVGMATSFTAEQRRQFSDEPLTKAAGSWALRFHVLGIICAPLWRVLDTVAEGDSYLLAIAVDVDLRGEGVGSILIDANEEKARAAGSKRLALDVSAKNTGGRRLYERRGMAVESGWPKARFVSPILLRMVKDL